MQGRFSDQQKVGNKVPLFNGGISFVQKMLGRKHECTGACTRMCTHAHTHSHSEVERSGYLQTNIDSTTLHGTCVKGPALVHTGK